MARRCLIAIFEYSGVIFWRELAWKTEKSFVEAFRPAQPSGWKIVVNIKAFQKNTVYVIFEIKFAIFIYYSWMSRE